MDFFPSEEIILPTDQSKHEGNLDVVMTSNNRKDDEGSFASESSIPCAPTDINAYVSPCTPHRRNFSGSAANSPDKSRLCSSSAMMSSANCCEMTPIARNTSEVFLTNNRGLLPLMVSPEEDHSASTVTGNRAGPPREISLSFRSLDETALLRDEYARVESEVSLSFRSLDEPNGGAAFFHGDDRLSYHQDFRRNSFVSHFRDSFTMDPISSNVNNDDDDSSLSIVYQAYQPSRSGSHTEFGLRESLADSIFKDDDASSLYRPIPLKKGNSTGTHFSVPSLRRGAPLLGDDNSSIRSWNESTIDGMSDLGSLRGSFDESDALSVQFGGIFAERKASVFDWLEDVRNNHNGIAVEEASSSKFLRADASSVRRASTRFTPVALTGRPPRRTLFPTNVTGSENVNFRT